MKGKSGDKTPSKQLAKDDNKTKVSNYNYLSHLKSRLNHIQLTLISNLAKKRNLSRWI